MYIRFVTPRLDDSSNVRQGIFQAAVSLCDQGQLAAHEFEELTRVIDWFNKNLERPEALRRSRRPRAVNKAISWFKPSATEHIRRMYHMASFLREHEIVVDVIKTRRLGYIVYQDDFQIVAEPFRETDA